MQSVANLDPVAVRQLAEGQEGPRSAEAHAKREEAARPAVEFGGALTHANGTRRGERVTPASPGSKTASTDAARAREQITEPRERKPDALPDTKRENRVRADRLADDRAAYDQRQEVKVGQRYDIEV